MTQETYPSGFKKRFYDRPAHQLRPRDRAWTPAERIGMAQKMCHRGKTMKVTLSAEPWREKVEVSK